MEEKVFSSVQEGKTHCTFFLVIHTSTAEGDAESLSNASSCQGMASLLQTPKHISLNLCLGTSNDKHFLKPARLNFEVKDLSSRICFLALLVISWHPPVLSSPIKYRICCLENPFFFKKKYV